MTWARYESAAWYRDMRLGGQFSDYSQHASCLSHFVGAAIANHALAEPAFRDCPDCLEMRVVEGGEFQMGSIFKRNPNGSITNKDEMPQHPVKVLSFAVSDRLMTSQEWDDCVRSGSCKAILKSGNCPHLADHGLRGWAPLGAHS